MKPKDDDEEIRRIVQRALLRFAPEARGRPKKEAPSDENAEASGSVDFITSCARSTGILPSPAPKGEPHPLAPAGLKLRELRLRSGWTTEEIADRTRFSAGLLAAFEAGDSAAAGELTRSDLEWLAGACCGTLADLLGHDHPWVRAARRRESRSPIDSLYLGSSGSFIDPTG